MISRRNTHLLPPLLVLGALLLAAVSVQAQDRRYDRQNGTTETLQIDLRTRPHWMNISGTRVEEIPMSERPNYDMFRLGGTYYVYQNDRWYSSSRDNGEFTYVDDRSVPSEFSTISREHWRNYPASWQGRNDQGSNDGSSTLQFDFGAPRHWHTINGTRVEELPMGERPDYDMFRFGGMYYARSNDRWYTAPEAGGRFTMVDENAVPTEFSDIPREHWRSYPTTWQDRRDLRRDQGQDVAPNTFQVNLGTRARWTTIRGTRVTTVRREERPDYDIFRYNGRYYVYNNNQWYMSRRSNGRFTMIDGRSVPNALASVPRAQWRNYPTTWVDQYGNVHRSNRRVSSYNR